MKLTFRKTWAELSNHQELEMAEVPEEDDTETGRAKMDTELRAIGQILRILDDLPYGARARAVAWLGDRFRNAEAKP